MKWKDHRKAGQGNGKISCETPLGLAEIDFTSGYAIAFVAGKWVNTRSLPEEAVESIKNYLLAKYMELGNFIENNYE